MIGSGRTGTVYLARHRELGEYRAVKAVRKDSVRYETFRKEALLLKDLRHPGIPVIYDIEEDEKCGYLIEEYLQGNSLETIAGECSPLPRRSVLQYGIQICSAVGYLHTAGPEPILHLDLQPKNLLVCGDTIKLIDFDQAAPISQANQDRKRFGTIGFAAPEQYDFAKELDERTDIYAIGCLLFYLTTGNSPDRDITPAVLGQKMWNREAGRIVSACLAADGKERYSSAEELKTDLENLLKETASSLVVAVYGNEACIGATHLSLALSASLWRRGIANCYEECHPLGNIRRLLGKNSRMDESGNFWIWGCLVRPYYGRQAAFLPASCQVVIEDRGALERIEEPVSPKEEPAAVLLIAGGKWWNRPPDEEFIRIYKERILLIYNFSHKRILLPRPRTGQGIPILQMPLFANPFCADPQAQRWLDMLWHRLEKILKERQEPGLDEFLVRKRNAARRTGIRQKAQRLASALRAGRRR